MNFYRLVECQFMTRVARHRQVTKRRKNLQSQISRFAPPPPLSLSLFLRHFFPSPLKVSRSCKPKLPSRVRDSRGIVTKYLPPRKENSPMQSGLKNQSTAWRKNIIPQKRTEMREKRRGTRRGKKKDEEERRRSKRMKKKKKQRKREEEGGKGRKKRT